LEFSICCLEVLGLGPEPDMVQDQNGVVGPLVTPKGRGGGWTLKIDLKITIELKIFNQFMKFRIDSMISIFNFFVDLPGY
jgi:hypothetical protein